MSVRNDKIFYIFDDEISKKMKCRVATTMKTIRMMTTKGKVSTAGEAIVKEEAKVKTAKAESLEVASMYARTVCAHGPDAPCSLTSMQQ